MGEAVFFRNLTTKGLTAVNSGERYFEGYLTVQVKDKQGEVTIVDELMKVLPVWIDRGAPISDTHSNRIIGKGINYSKVEYKDKDGEIYPAIQITGKIHKNYELDNDIWQKIKSGEYKGLSFGGATKSDREPMRMKDGSIAYSLKDLEHYEVAVCRDPAVPLALITEFNTLAKAAVDGEDLGGGRMLIKCDKYGCFVDKVDNNSEAGIKAQEARENALVYDDKTIDHVNQTPLENQAKIKKGEDTCPKCGGVASSEEHARAKKKGQDWSNADGDRHSMYNQDTDEGGMGKKHTGPKPCKCGDPKCKDPKCKKHKREVGTGHGAEENNTADGWSGSGSPYPKNASQEVEDQDEVSAEHKTHNTVVPAQGKETKIVTPDGQIYYIEFPEDDTNPLGGKPGKTGNPTVSEKSEPGLKDVEAKEETPEDKEFDKTWHKLNPSFPKKKKKKAIITNIHSLLKNLDFMLKRQGEKIGEGEKDTRNWEDKHDEEWEWHLGELMDTKEGKRAKRILSEHVSHVGEDDELEPPRKKVKPKKAAITHIRSRLKNIQTRIEISNFLLRKDSQTENKREPPKRADVESPERIKRRAEFKEWLLSDSPMNQTEFTESKVKLPKTGKAPKIKSYFMRVKDGEFGGMNTGEVEWTEPRDTANSRKKRGKDVD